MPFCSSASDDIDEEFDQLPRALRFRLRFAKKKEEAHAHYTIIHLGNRRILKKGCESTEYEALRFVDRHTSVPIPKVLGVYNLRDGLLVDLEAIPGRPLDVVWHDLSHQQRKRIVEDVGRFVDQLRKIATPARRVVGSATLGASFDHRFGKGRFGPFYTIDAFHNFIRRGHPIEDFEEPEVRRCHGRKTPYTLKFAHGHLTPQNILIDDNGRTAAVVGWESAGWYPEYWEYTQMHHGTPGAMGDWLVEMERVLTKYDDEVLAEAVLRRRYIGRVYDGARSVKSPSIASIDLRKEQEEIDMKNTESTSG